MDRSRNPHGGLPTGCPETGMKKEIVIAGGGIAGLSLGIALRTRGIEVILCEAGRYPRHRVCGEFISGVSEETLDFLGVLPLLADAEQNRMTSWWDSDGVIVKRALPKPARGVSRFRLDARMAERFVELGGHLKEGERVPRARSSEEGVVFATGRPAKRESQWLGLKAHLLDFKLETDLEMHLGEGGYLGMSSIEGGRVNACGLFKIREDLKVSKDAALAGYVAAIGLNTLAEKISLAERDSASQMGVSAFVLGEQKHEDQSGVRLGDQEAIIAPLSGNGMSMAFESSAAAVPLIESYCSGAISWKEVGQQLNTQLSRQFRRRIRVANFLNPMLTSRRMQGGFAAMSRASLLPFQTLYQLTR